MRDVRVAGARAGTAELHRAEMVGCILERCDVAGVLVSDGRADRVVVRDSRLRAVTFAGGVLQDVDLVEVTGEELSLRFSTLRRVVFRDCRLPGLDLTETVLEDVRFEGCDLTGARFAHARVSSLRIEGCDLTGCSGAAALTGASVHPDALVSLAPSLAQALGLRLEERAPQ